jgi:FixJ family two-component response regulator
LAKHTLNDPDAVVIVDDDRSMLHSLRRVLRQHGFEPVVFGSATGLLAHSAFARARCIVLDINLRDGSGIELQRQLHNASTRLYYGE